MEKKKLQLRKETMAMLDDPQMHGINGGGPTGPTVIGPPGSPGTTCAATCAATCAETCAANCTATMNATCQGALCAGSGTFCDPNQTSGKCPTTHLRGCGGASGVTGDTNVTTDTIYCQRGITGAPGGGTC